MFAANVILDIEIDPKLENIIYADISTYSRMSDEEEILIDFGTSFRIVKMVFYPENNIWLIDLVCVNEIDKILDSYIDLKRSQQEDNTVIAAGLIFFGQKERACRFLKESMDVTNNNRDKFELNCELGEIYAQSGQFKESVDYFQEAYRLCTSFYPDSVRLHSVTFWLAMMYACLNEHNQAFNYLTIQLEFPNPAPYSLPRCYGTSWSYLVNNEESLRFDPYRLAYEYLQQCLIQFEQDKDISCKIHLYLSLILLKCDREAITLHPLDESLMHLKLSGQLASKKSTDFLTLYYYYMGFIYESMERYNKAKRYYRKIVTLPQFQFNSSEKRTIIHVRIASCYAAQKIYTLAIEHNMKALEQSLENGDSILISKVRAHLGITFIDGKQYNEAIEQLIHITLLSGIITRRFIQEIDLIIGETFLKANDTINAVKYYSTYLDRYEEVGQEVFECWCDTCEYIMDIYLSEGQLDLSTIYAKKMLEYRIKNCPDDFQEIMKAQILVAFCYKSNEEWQESVDYYNMSYDTLSEMMAKLSTDEYNPLISDEAILIQSELVSLYTTIHDYEKAIYHANIALETEVKRRSRDKIKIASCYDCIGWCYYKKSEYDKALDFCTKGLHTLYTSVSEFDRSCCNIYHSLTAIWLELGDLKQASTYSVKAIQILASSIEFEEKKCMLDHFYLLLERIYKQEGASFQSDHFSNTTDAQTMLITESNSSDAMGKHSNSLSEDQIRFICVSREFRFIDYTDEDNSFCIDDDDNGLHKIITKITHSPSSPIYPVITYIKSANRHSSDLETNQATDENCEDVTNDTINNEVEDMI